jgi:hypothetical protein
MIRFACLTLLLPFTISAVGLAQNNVGSAPFLFYHGRHFGSEANFNPVSMILNSGYGILQYPNRSRKIFEIDYANGFRNVMRNVMWHPFTSINRYGWSRFIGDEVIPMDVNKKNAQYWPNYQNHLIGAGMEYVLVCEWYRYHNYPAPVWLGTGTMLVYHVMNETVENGSYIGDNVDPIADLLIFDPLGMVLFSLNGVPEFFAGTLNLAEWSAQICYNPWTQTVENEGVNYSIKYKLPFSERWSLFYYWGMTGLVGLSYDAGEGRNLSFGAGLRAKELVPVGDQSIERKLTTKLTWNVGAFYDRENSLLASVLISGISDYKLHINIYPGVVSIASVSPGLFCAFGDGGKFVSGINFSYVPFGLSAGVSE